MGNRTNSLTAAAISLGINADLLERILPDLKIASQLITDGSTTARGINFTFRIDAVNALHLYKAQCGMPGSPPCSCGEV